MSRFGWPRPGAEGIVEELAALQAAEGKLPSPSPDVVPPGVRAGTAFPTVRGTGYDTVAVDSFLARCGELSAEEIRGSTFATAHRGYDIRAVDAALDHLVRSRVQQQPPPG